MNTKVSALQNDISIRSEKREAAVLIVDVKASVSKLRVKGDDAPSRSYRH